jgi:upstream-binding transcription factor
MSAIMGEKWKSVSEEERKPYLERYQIEKDIYLKVNHPRYPPIFDI